MNGLQNVINFPPGNVITMDSSGRWTALNPADGDEEKIKAIADYLSKATHLRGGNHSTGELTRKSETEKALVPAEKTAESAEKGAESVEEKKKCVVIVPIKSMQICSVNEYGDLMPLRPDQSEKEIAKGKTEEDGERPFRLQRLTEFDFKSQWLKKQT